MATSGASSAAGPPDRPEAVEVRVAAGPALARALAPLVVSFARVAGLGLPRARALASEVVALLATAARGKEPVRLRLMRRARKLRVCLRCGGATARRLRKARPGRVLNDVNVQSAGEGAMVLTLEGPCR